MKKNYSSGSNAMYQEHEAMQPEPKYKLRIANSRGKRPVMTDIKKAYNLINGLLIEINDCEGRAALKKCDSLLWNILHDND